MQRTTVDVGASRRVQVLEKAALRWSATTDVTNLEDLYDDHCIRPHCEDIQYLEPITRHEAHAQLIDSTIVCVCV